MHDGYDILWESSKVFTTGHGYQKCAVVHFFEPYLHDKGIKNYVASFNGEKIKIIFVIAVAA